MRNKRHIVAVSVFCALQACSFTNKPFEKYDAKDYVRTATDLKVGEERIVPINGKAYESTSFIQKNNVIQCPRPITYRDGVARYQISEGTYKTLGLIEVEKGKKLPFFQGSYQSGAIGGSSGMALYFPVNPDGSLYKNYYTDPYGNLRNPKGELKEWGGSGTAIGDCNPPIAQDLAKISVCTVYYNGPTHQNGYTAPTLKLESNNSRKNIVITAQNNLQFCGVNIDINETTDILRFTVKNIRTNQ